MFKVLWTSRNLKNPSAREQRALDFIAIIQKPIRGLRISLLAKEFSKIPELNVFNQKFPDLSHEARKVFEKVYKLNAKDPKIGMRVITILACNVECAFYTPKLKEVVFQTLKEWLLSDNLPRRKRIEWGIFCWRNWPGRQSDYDKNIFVEPMVKLFVEESKIDAEYILTIYDGLFDRRSEDSYIFNQFREDPEDFMAFSRNIKHIRPHFLVNALLKYIRDGKNGYGGYTADIEKLKSSCNELYESLEKNESLTESQLERITRELILYSYPELPWYNQLPQKLWEIEKKKNLPDKQSLRNYFIVANNAPNNSSFIDEINQSYRKWIEVYEVQNWANVDSLIKHAKEMLDLVNSSLHATYPSTRNKSFDKPNSFLLVDETLSSYWEMIDFFKVHDFELYLYALETALEKPTFTVEVTENLGSKAKQLFVDSFEEFCVSDVEKASLLVTYMISRSGYTEIKIHIRKVLDIIYPVLAKIDSAIAEKALSDGLKPEHSHMPLWRPRLKNDYLNRKIG